MIQKFSVILLLLGFVLTSVAGPARAQSLIRDAEIERSLSELARPIIVAAGLNPTRIRILVVNDQSLNAFVGDTRHVFLHSGLILKMSTPAELQGVISHELAHIANGHITRRMANMRNARTAAGLGALLSIAAAVAGAGEAALGIAAGTAASAQRVFLSHTRAEEASADQSGMGYMARAGIDPHAMVGVLDNFRGQELVSAAHQDPYVLSHPLSRDRLRNAKAYANAYQPRGAPDPASDYWFERAKGKLSAFLRSPSWTLRRIKANDTSELALMQRAVAQHRIPKPAAAIATVNALIALRPDDPFYHELKGQILLESRHANAAVPAYAKAVQLAPRQALIQAGYGRALLALDTTSGNKRALEALEKARARDPHDARMLRDLAVAYARAGDNGMASLATAERYALSGRLRDAGIHAKRAEGLLPRGSSGWNRSQDILRAAEAAANRKKRG